MPWLHLDLISHAIVPCPVVKKTVLVNLDSKKFCSLRNRCELHLHKEEGVLAQVRVNLLEGRYKQAS